MRALLTVLLLLGPAATASAQCEDEVLSAVAAELVLAGGEPTGDELLAAARRAGESAPTVHGLAIRDADTTRMRTWLRALSARLHAPVACGAAQTADRILAIAAPRGGRLDPDETFGRRFRVALAEGYAEPIVYVEDASGSTERLLPSSDGLVDVPEDLREPVRVQLVAQGPDGPRPVAERTIGQREDRSIPSTDEDEPLDARIAELRERAAMPALRPHRLLATLARQHAETVCRVRRAAHELQPGRDPRARVRSGGIEARHVGEVVARAADRDAALDALSRSPSHRSALLDRRMTDAGAGVATDTNGRTCVVVLLAAWPRLVAGPPRAESPRP